MAETTIALKIVTVVQCESRSSGFGHCWHASVTPVQGPGCIIFPNLCCFCAPSYMKLDVIVPWQLEQEAVVAEQMKHGGLVVITRQEKPRAQIAVAQGATPTPLRH